jgi:hypothetical protein
MQKFKWIAAAAWLVFASVGCKAATNGHSNAASAGAAASTRDGQSDAGARANAPAGDAGVPKGSAGSRPGSDNNGSSPRPADGGAPPSMPGMMDAGSMTDVRAASDASTNAADMDAHAGGKELGSCCTAHDGAGCSNADLQVCVCEKLPSCCTDVWDAACVLIVKQKYCQPGVRDCVCGDQPGQWAQHTCCNSSWSDNFCDQVAEQKCGAAAGCL